jgi:malate synthase
VAYLDRAGLQVDQVLVDFVEQEALPGTKVSALDYWARLASLLATFMPRNRELLAIRERLQASIDEWHRKYGPVANDPAGYERHLREIGYLVPEPPDFTIETTGLDPEIASLCGPQLVVPVSNARYALNAANARWGSLYDVLYGTDVIAREGELAPGKGYNAKRGAAVVARAAAFLDQAFPLANGSHADVTAYVVAETRGSGALAIDTAKGPTALKDQSQFVGFSGDSRKGSIVLLHHGLHAELVIDRDGLVGKTHPAGLNDIIVESALTTIQDCEDSVAAVDAADKVGVYRNWLGLMNGTLEDTFEKGGKNLTRRLNSDRVFRGAKGGELTLKGRALLLCRNVGHLMTTPAVLDRDGRPVGEGLLDAAMTVLCALHDKTNSTTGAVYVVKPRCTGRTR